MKVRKIFSIAINLIAAIASTVGFIVVGNSLTSVHFIKFFTLVTNLLIIVFSLVSVGYGVDALIKKDKETVLRTPIFVFKLITATCSLITFLTVVCYLQYTVYIGIGPDNVLFWNNIFHHYLAPLAFFAGLIFFDLDKKYSFKTTFFGIIVLVMYMAYAIPLSNLNLSWWGEAPYVFMDMNNVKWFMFLLMPGFLITWDFLIEERLSVMAKSLIKLSNSKII